MKKRGKNQSFIITLQRVKNLQNLAKKMVEKNQVLID